LRAFVTHGLSETEHALVPGDTAEATGFLPRTRAMSRWIGIRMITLFVDTNVLLSFYHLTSEDLEELRKLIVLIDSNQIKLVLTQQVKDEFKRNRAAKVADALKKLGELKLAGSFPAFVKDYDPYRELRVLLNKAGKKHAELIEVVTKNAKAGSLKADALIDDLFNKADVIDISEPLYLSALERVRRGNPPGKEGSLGDAINWECLLANIDVGREIHLVSEDKDYKSQLSTEELNEFLADEWKKKKKSAAVFYVRISEFFKTNFPNIKIASEAERDLLIEELRASGSFARTHAIMAKMLRHTDFSAVQIEQLVQIAQTNGQVGWIIGDPDVHDFFASLQKQQSKLSPEVAARLDALVKGEQAQSLS
jgi:hypothetical protein